MLRKHLNAGTIIAVVALVFAMTGGALAVTSKGDGSATVAAAKSKKAKVIPGPRGPRGRQGLQGTVGPAGAAGPQGPAGLAGEKGAAGTPGAAGKDGNSGVGTTAKTFTGPKTLGSENCENGGLEVTSASGTALVCNGAKGAKGTAGTKGEPWTPNGTLPPGATETGSWGFTGSSSGFAVAPISFTVPLATTLTGEEHFHYIKIGDSLPTGCIGSAEKPGAEPGNLCVFGVEEKSVGNLGVGGSAVSFPPGPKASTTGAIVFTESAGGEFVFAYGTWAVTAAE